MTSPFPQIHIMRTMKMIMQNLKIHAVDDLVGTETFEDVDNIDPGATGEASSSQKDKEVHPEDSSGKKSKTVIRPHEKRNVPRSQVQALGSLAFGVKKMAETQTKRLKMQEESQKGAKKKVILF